MLRGDCYLLGFEFFFYCLKCFIYVIGYFSDIFKCSDYRCGIYFIVVEYLQIVGEDV